MTMLEDYWLPRREGGRGTEITTLPAGQNLGEMDDVLYFQKKLFRSLNVPVSRLEPDAGMSLGRATEINRDEVKFQKFVNRLRMRFSQLFFKCMERQLLVKGIMTDEEWHRIQKKITFDFRQDSHFTELKNLDILNERITAINNIDPYLGKYYSMEWAKKNILHQTEDQIKEMSQQMEAETPDEGGDVPDDEMRRQFGAEE
jgi:hypothetical protein